MDKDTIADERPATGEVDESTLGRFVASIKARTEDTLHHRLLDASLKANPAEAVEEEFRAIVSELANETQQA